MDLRSIINKLDRIDSKKNLFEDAATIANNIKKAVVRWGTDEVAVYDAIAQLTSAAEWEQVKKVYAADGRDIEADIANDFGGAELDYVRGLLASKGIKSEILRIGEPSDHLTPVEPNTPPPPAAEPEGKSDDKGQQNTQVTPDKVDVSTGIMTSTDPNTKAWEVAFGGSVDKIVAWAVKKYPKVTPELVKEYLKSTPPVGDDVATLNQIDTWAKDPGKLTAKYEYDQAKFKLWEEYTFKPLSYLIALATSYYASDPDTYRKVTTDEVKEFLSKANLVGTIKAKGFEQGSQEAAMAAFEILRNWVKTGKAPAGEQQTQTTIDLDPKLKKIKDLLDKAEGKVTNEGSIQIAKSLVESFGYLLEDFSRLSQAEKEQLDQLINDIRQQARTGDPAAKELLDRYNAIKNAPPNAPPKPENKPENKPDNKPRKEPAPPDFDNGQDVQNEPPKPPAEIDKPPDLEIVKKISLAFKEVLKENPPIIAPITDKQKEAETKRVSDILFVVGKLKYVNEWDAVVSYCKTPLGFNLRNELKSHLNMGALRQVNDHLKKLQPISKNKIQPLIN